MNLSKIQDPRQWKKWYLAGAVPQPQFPAGSLKIIGVGTHFKGPAAGHQTLSLGEETLASGPGWRTTRPLCHVVVPGERYKGQLGSVLNKLPANAMPLELFFS